jgi:tRNA (guanine-N7-)-methyltransferase
MPDQPWGDPVHPHLIYRLTSLTERLKVELLFPAAQPLEVDLGSGDGSFLAQYARAHPERNFIGVERLLGRARKLERKGLRAGLINLRVVRLEAGYFTEYLLPPASVSVFHIYFPDPWPKKKHHRHRLINARFTEVLRRALQPGGQIHIRTDNAEYHAWIQTAFAANAAFQSIETPPELRALTTDFEKDFNQKGITTLHAAYQRMELTEG